MELKFIESEIGKKKIKQIKRIDLVYSIIIALMTIILVLLLLDTKKIVGAIVFIIIFIVICEIIKIIKNIQVNKLMLETLAKEICIDGFINLHIYNAKKVEKKINKPKFNKIYNYSLLNVIDGYLRKGDVKKANEIIKTLESKEIDNTIKAFLIKYKATIAYNANNIKEFNEQYNKFEEISNSLQDKIKSQIIFSLNLQKYVVENNKEKVSKICDNLLNDKLLLNKIVGSYYKGVLLEKENDEEYKKYYKFVVENGNDLNIAKIAGEKLGITSQIKYRLKRHIFSGIITGLILLILVSFTVFISTFYYEMSKIKWDTGEVYINEKRINLPCTIAEFEDIFNTKIDTTQIDTYGFYKLYLNENYFNVGETTFLSGKYIQLHIEDNVVKGVYIDISNSWNDELDEELGAMVVFPQKITANSTIAEIQEAYKTGIINPAMRSWKEDIVDSKTMDVIESGGLNYSGDKFDISIKYADGKVESIFYYCE